MKTTLSEQLKAAQEQHAAELSARDAQIAKLTADCASASQESADLKAKLSHVTEQHEILCRDNVELCGEVEELKQQLEAAKTSAHQKAADIVAAIGVPAVESAPTISQQTAEGLWEQYRSLQKSDPREATRFFRKNQQQMDR